MQRNPLRFVLSLAILPAITQPAWAHPGHGGYDFLDGAAHPIFGLDHLLAMVTVGLLALRIGGRGMWLTPGAFMAGMLIGGGLAALGVPLLGVEPAILGSVLVLGMLVAAASAPSLKYAASAAGAFALFHGHAHAAEMVEGGSLAAYACGFLISTAMLHAAGIAVGFAMARLIDVKAVRLAGGLVSVLGALLICGLV
jgi:urease accessory protein